MALRQKTVWIAPQRVQASVLGARQHRADREEQLG
jgi:hypothetical protein